MNKLLTELEILDILLKQSNKKEPSINFLKFNKDKKIEKQTKPSIQDKEVKGTGVESETTEVIGGVPVLPIINYSIQFTVYKDPHKQTNNITSCIETYFVVKSNEILLFLNDIFNSTSMHLYHRIKDSSKIKDIPKNSTVDNFTNKFYLNITSNAEYSLISAKFTIYDTTTTKANTQTTGGGNVPFNLKSSEARVQ